MKKKLFPILFALMSCILCSMSAIADEAYAEFTTNNKTLTFHYDNLRSTRTGITYDLVSQSGSTGWSALFLQDTVLYIVFEPSFANARPTTTAYWFSNFHYVKHITGLNYLNTSEVTNMICMFSECYALESIDLSNFNTSNVTIMRAMFYLCKSVTSLDLSTFDTSNVTDMFHMFRHCDNMTSVNLSSFNTANVTNMGYMFDSCYELRDLDVTNFNTANVTNMQAMFQHCRELTTLDVRNFNTSNVTTMESMFYACKKLETIDLSNFDTGNVTDMRLMLSGCHNMKYFDLSSFNTSNVSNMNRMFESCHRLYSIFVSDRWSNESVTNNIDMFYNCECLIGGAGTAYDPEHLDGTYAHVDEGASNPGYFTYRHPFIRGDVNRDGKVNIADVTALINYLLSNDASGVDILAVDTNDDGKRNISDVTALTNFLLSSMWP